MTKQEFLKGIKQIRTIVMNWNNDAKYKGLCNELRDVYGNHHPLYDLFTELCRPRNRYGGKKGIDNLWAFWLGHNTLENNINRVVVLDMFKETVLAFKLYKGL